jgi:transposase-like protein
MGQENDKPPGIKGELIIVHSLGVLLQPEMERRPIRVILQLGRSLTMRKRRKNYTAVEKVAILRRHLIDHVPVSDLCDEHQLSPTLFYAWQKQFFENGPTAFERKNAAPQSQHLRTIAALRDKLQRKNEVVAELMEDHIKLKKELGEL